MRFLVADDDNDIRALVVQLLESKVPGAYIVNVSRGLEALLQFHIALSQGTPFDAMVLDVAMPDIPGTAVAQIVRILEKFPEKVPRARIVFFSGHDTLVQPESITRAEPDAYIVKPSDPAVLLKAILGK